MNSREKYLLIQLAKSWNNLDVRFIEHLLAEDFTYESQWVISPIQGKDNFLPYLKSKFHAIAFEIKNGEMQVFAELANHPDLQGTDWMVLTQTTKTEILHVLIVIELHEELISRIDICFIPDPETATLTGNQPN
jgi:hypothetical protein